MPHILCLSNYPAELVEEWVADLDCRVTVAGRDQQLSDLDTADVEIAIGDASRHFLLDAAGLARLPRCRAVIQPSVGVDGVVDLAAARERGIAVANVPGYNADAVADWTIMAMLVVLRHGVSSELRNGGWHAPELGRELGTLTVGLLGYGAVGQAVHRRLRGFGATVLATSPGPVPQVEELPTFVELEELVESSDVLSLHAPLTPQTRHLIDGPLLARMREGSVLVNAARGGLIDEDALVAALRAGRPAAAALDVFDPEPLPQSSALLGLEQVYLTPHIAASSQQARVRVRGMVRDNLRRAVLGEELAYRLV